MLLGWFAFPRGGGMPILPAQASGAPKMTLFGGDCRVVGDTVSCDSFSDRP